MTHSLNDYDLFVFDFDGTIMDTEKFHYKAWINILQKFVSKNIYFDYSTYIKNFHTIDTSNKKKYLLMKYDIENYDTQSYHTLSYDSLYELKQKEYNKLINENEVLLVNNFEKIIEFIHNNNKKFVIVTNTSIKNINFFSEKYPIITKNVDRIYTKENFINKKPHPECYLKVINDYPNHKIIGFEDSLYGFHCLYQVDKIKPVYIFHDDYYYNEYIIKTYDNIIVCTDYNLYNINVQLNLQKDVNNYTKTNNFIENIIDNNINQFILNKTNIQNIIYQISIIIKSLKKENHIYLSGMGKSGYICKKSASTWQSLSLKCSYIDLPNLPHGDFGIFRDQDVIILISNSGNTDEIIYILKYLKENSENFKITTISIVANKDSKMEEYSDYTFVLNNIKEADVINMTPSTSSLIFMSILDGIAINIRNDISKDEFKLYHPAGALGKRI